MTSRLLGLHNEELVFDFSEPDLIASDPDLFGWALRVSVRLPSSGSPLRQDICSTCYGQLPDISPLAQLLKRVPSAVFRLEEQNFELQIFEHTVNSGPVSGFIANCRCYTHNACEISDWEVDVIDRLLIEPVPYAADFRFAFAVEFDSLQSFHEDLAVDLHRCAIRNG